MHAACHYTVMARHPASHFFQITLHVHHPHPQGQLLWLPNWIVGSYMIRDFARHIVSLSARTAQGLLLDVNKVGKNQWKIEPHVGDIRVEYEVYAWDLSVRGAHLDQFHGYFNGPCLFLAVAGQEQMPVTLDIQCPDGVAGWKVATGLTPRATLASGFGEYEAPDYASLLDGPVEMGTFDELEFAADAVPHRMVLTGRQRADKTRLAKDLGKICETCIRFWHDPAPFAGYLFQVMVTGNGYGGLEHGNSTSLMCSRDDLPLSTEPERPSDKYRTFLGLCSHEYFHAWLVKRIKPAVLMQPDLERENYTPLLWVFEGFTSYYDDLILARSGVISSQDYLDLLGQQISRYLKTPGRHVQSVTESSFDAWTKYYKPDENTPNSVVSYYIKGSLVALCIDLTLRQDSNNTLRLDDVMRLLWHEHGKPGIGVEPDTVQRLVERLSGRVWSSEWTDWLHGTAELPLKPLLEKQGISLNLRADSGANGQVYASLGVRGQASEGGFLLQNVWRGGAADAAGLSAGDLIIAVDGLKVSSQLEKVIASYPVGGNLCIHAFRRDELLPFEVHLQAAPFENCALALPSDPGLRQRAEQWILDQ